MRPALHPVSVAVPKVCFHHRMVSPGNEGLVDTLITRCAQVLLEIGKKRTYKEQQRPERRQRGPFP